MGCETHTAIVTDRGGARPLITLKAMTSITWNRLLDDISYATVVLSPSDCEEISAGQGLSQRIEPRRHELVIYRNDERVWEGPIEEVQDSAGTLTIRARDVLTYLDARAISRYWPGPNNGGPTLMTDRADQIIRYELANQYAAPGLTPTVNVPAWESVTPPANVLPYLEVRLGSILTTTETMPFEMTVYENLRNLARGGLDYTTIGRKILIWDSAEEIGRINPMTDADFNGRISVYASGQELVGVQHVTAPREEDYDNPLPPNDTSNIGSAMRDISYYGPWANIHTRSEEGGETSQAALNVQALRVSAGKNPVPITIAASAGSQVQLGATRSINHLVAGVSVPIVASFAGRPVNSLQRFANVTVTENDRGEQITATLDTDGGEEA